MLQFLERRSARGKTRLDGVGTDARADTAGSFAINRSHHLLVEMEENVASLESLAAPLLRNGRAVDWDNRVWVMGVKARANDWDPIRGLHQGQRSWCRANRPDT